MNEEEIIRRLVRAKYETNKLGIDLIDVVMPDAFEELEPNHVPKRIIGINVHGYK